MLFQDLMKDLSELKVLMIHSNGCLIEMGDEDNDFWPWMVIEECVACWKEF